MRERIGSYRIERELGHGGMGMVFKARHDDGRLVALKTIRPAHAADPEVRRRLLAEAKAQAALHHPNVVTLYEAFEDNGELFIAMEYVDGETLAALLERAPGDRLPLAKALPLFVQLLDALEYVHAQTIIHRDITPRNVMVTHDGVVKVADFGLALLAGEPRLTASLQLLGTREYMSPEQLQAKDLDHRSDLYTAALVLFRVLAGQGAFQSKEYLAQIHERMAGPPDLQRLAPDVPPAVCEAVAIALQFEPDHRFASAADFRKQLKLAESGFWPSAAVPEETIAFAPPEPPQTVSPPPESRKASNAAAFLVIVLCVGGTAWLVAAHLDTPESVGAPVVSTPGRVNTAQTTPPVPEPPKPEPKPEPEKEKPTEPPKRPPRIDSAPPIKVERNEHQKEIEALRDEIHSTLAGTSAKVADKQFAAALEELAYLDRSSQRYPAELWREREDIAHLRTRAIQGEADERVRQQEEEGWKARLTAIEKLIDAGRFPEAINSARDLKNDPKAPFAVAARAAELQAEAERRLPEAAAKEMRLGETTNTIRKPSSPPRKKP